MYNSTVCIYWEINYSFCPGREKIEVWNYEEKDKEKIQKEKKRERLK